MAPRNVVLAGRRGNLSFVVTFMSRMLRRRAVIGARAVHPRPAGGIGRRRGGPRWIRPRRRLTAEAGSYIVPNYPPNSLGMRHENRFNPPSVLRRSRFYWQVPECNYPRGTVIGRTRV